MSKVLVYTISRAATPERLTRLADTLRNGAATAGHDHDWLVWANSPEVLAAYPDTLGNGINAGQHVATNAIIERARADGYTHLCRVDDDCEWVTRRWLKKLIEIEQRVLANKQRYTILAPRVIGLKNPIPIEGTCEVDGVPLQFVRVLGGVCRLMPLPTLEGYVSDVRGAMGAGDATGLAAHCIQRVIPMFIVPWVRVKHRTIVQEQESPNYFAEHAIWQSVPYVPARIA